MPGPFLLQQFQLESLHLQSLSASTGERSIIKPPSLVWCMGLSGVSHHRDGVTSW